MGVEEREQGLQSAPPAPPRAVHLLTWEAILIRTSSSCHWPVTALYLQRQNPPGRSIRHLTLSLAKGERPSGLPAAWDQAFSPQWLSRPPEWGLWTRSHPPSPRTGLLPFPQTQGAPSVPPQHSLLRCGQAPQAVVPPGRPRQACPLRGLVWESLINAHWRSDQVSKCPYRNWAT